MAFYIPFRVCLWWDDESNDRLDGIFWFEISADIAFGIDIVLNFFTAYHDHDHIVYNHKKIALRYLKGFFILD